MNELGNITPEEDLKCDFPARESFREALLSRLQEATQEDLQAARWEEQDEGQDAFQLVDELEESDLEWIAAAQDVERDPYA